MSDSKQAVSSKKRMRILVAVINFGTKNDHYLQRLLAEYRGMSHDVHAVVLTNVPKNVGEGVEVVVLETPRGDPWAFPFPHKQILADRVDDYDLFIYSEDDTLITQRNIDAFLEVTEILPEGEIAGFIRSEKGASGERYLSTVHASFHWDPASVVSRGSYTFAYFTNAHSASYILTRAQLRRAIESHGFLVGPHQGRYDLLVSAATDPYTQCGFRKVVCISRINDFVLPHLPDRYVGKLGLAEVEFFIQLKALEAIQKQERPCVTLMNAETKLGKLMWSKSYYEPARADVLAMIPRGARNVLSFGCGSGAMEAELMKQGIKVTAIPLDTVIGACAEARGLEVAYSEWQSAVSVMAGRYFDCIFLSNILHLNPAPHELLSELSKLLSPGGTIVAVVPNLSGAPTRWRRIKGDADLAVLGSYERAGVHQTSGRLVRKWFRQAGLSLRNMVPVVPPRQQVAYRAAGRLLPEMLAEEFLISAGTSH